MSDPGGSGQRAPKVYTRKGDDGSTGLLFGGRVLKTAPAIEANGDIDEAQAVLGLARAEAPAASEAHEILTGLCRDLWRLMGEVATAPENRAKLGDDGVVSAEMVTALERRIDDLSDRFPPIREFVVPGQARLPALLDHARTVVRRAERSAASVDALAAAAAGGPSHVLAYLNRLSDLLWTMARWLEDDPLPARADDDPEE